MAMLLNRKYGSRLDCVYYILQSMYAKFGTTKPFVAKDLLFNPDDADNVHTYCQKLIPVLDELCCPYLDNTLNESKCYATQAIDCDTTKRKAASDIIGSLEALNFISRKNEHFYITSEGEAWVKSNFDSRDWFDLTKKAVLSYGAIIGLLSKIDELTDEFDYKGIYLSYPQTEEKVLYRNAKGEKVEVFLSTGSERDSNTRTVSRLLTWCVTAGFIEPLKTTVRDSDLPQIKYYDFMNSKQLTVRKFTKTELLKSLFQTKPYVNNPLSYSRLHKSVKSLREKGGETLREATMQYDENILDRRFVFIYTLNHFSKLNKSMDFEEFVNVMGKYSTHFFSNNQNALEIMGTEINIADLAGIPFDITEDRYLSPKTTINEAVLIEDAPKETIELAKAIIQDMS